MYIQIVYYKTNKQSLVFIVQPCHLYLLLQGIALLSPHFLSCLISVFTLPFLSGAVLAIFFPDTSGLDQPFEEASYWIQHYLISVMPLYLLMRNDFIASRISCLESLLISSWGTIALHFPGYEVLDLVTQVNTMFMLCPTGAMRAIFAEVPAWVLLPSYRTTLCLVFFVVGGVISGTYIVISRVLMSLLRRKGGAKSE